MNKFLTVLLYIGCAYLFENPLLGSSSNSSDPYLLNELDRVSQRIVSVEKYLQGNLAIEPRDATRVIVLGTTGSGKSTLVHALAGKTLVANYTQAGDGFEIGFEDGFLPNFTTGNGIRSDTYCPLSWHDSSLNLVYWDCPGFLDSRGPDQDVTNAFSIDQLFSTPSRIKILLAIQASDFETARGMEVIRVLNRVASLVPNSDQLNQGLSLVVTKKLSNSFSVDSLIKGLLFKVHQEISRRSSVGESIVELEKPLSILDFLVKNSTNISSFNMPTSSGTYVLQDRSKIVQSLRLNPVLNPRHALYFDDTVLFDVLSRAEKFCSVPKLAKNWRTFVRQDFQKSDLNVLNNWKFVLSSLKNSVNDLNTPGIFFSAFDTHFSACFSKEKSFTDLYQEFVMAQKYADFITRLADGSSRPLPPIAIQSVFSDVLDDLIVKLNSLIDHKTLVQQRELDTFRIRQQLDAAVAQRTIQKEEADKQYRSLDERIKRDKAESDRVYQQLQNQLRDHRRDSDERIRREVDAEKSRTASQIRNLQSRLDESSNNLSLIRALRERIQELELELRRRSGGGQVVFLSPFGGPPFGGPSFGGPFFEYR